jgi:hypothetical protein
VERRSQKRSRLRRMADGGELKRQGSSRPVRWKTRMTVADSSGCVAINARSASLDQSLRGGVRRVLCLAFPPTLPDARFSCSAAAVLRITCKRKKDQQFNESQAAGHDKSTNGQWRVTRTLASGCVDQLLRLFSLSISLSLSQISSQQQDRIG